MRTLYLDTDFRLHIEPFEGFRSIETDKFDNYCDELTECYRYIPQGDFWVKPNGEIIYGEFIQPWCKTDKAEVIQMTYDHQREVESLITALNEAVEEVYRDDTKVYDNV